MSRFEAKFESYGSYLVIQNHASNLFKLCRTHYVYCRFDIIILNTFSNIITFYHRITKIKNIKVQ